MWDEVLDVLKISMGDTVWRDAPCMDGALADWSMVSKEDITFAYLSHMNIQMTAQFCSYSLTCLQQIENVRMTWPLSMKLDFCGHICALLHSEAASLEEWVQVFKSISWFKLNSVIRDRETAHWGDLLNGLEPTHTPGVQKDISSSLNWQQWGKTQPVSCISGDYS